MHHSFGPFRIGHGKQICPLATELKTCKSSLLRRGVFIRHSERTELNKQN